MELSISGQEYEVGMDVSNGESVAVEEHYMHPSAEYPDGSYMHKIGGEVTIATGHFATLHPDKKSLYWHGDQPPFVFIDTTNWPWNASKPVAEKENNCE